MQVLVVATPQHPVPTSEMPGIIEGATDWWSRHEDEFDLFGTSPGGGGFAFSSDEVRPSVAGDTGFTQLREAMAAQAAPHQ